MLETQQVQAITIPAEMQTQVIIHLIPAEMLTPVITLPAQAVMYPEADVKTLLEMMLAHPEIHPKTIQVHPETQLEMMLVLPEILLETIRATPTDLAF